MFIGRNQTLGITSKFYLGFMTFFSAFAGLSLAHATEGVFMIVRGDVKVISNNTIETARVGLKIKEGVTIQSGPDSKAKIVMKDKNVISIHPSTTVTLEAYQNNSQMKKVELKLSEGQVRALVKEKYDEQKNTFRIKTPTAVAGVRGTDFLVSFDKSSRISDVKTFKGVVAVFVPTPTPGMGTTPVIVKAGEQISTQKDGRLPPRPENIPPEELQKLDKETDPEKEQAQNKPDSPQDKQAENQPDGEQKDPKSSQAVQSEENSQDLSPSSANAQSEKKPKDAKTADLGNASHQGKTDKEQNDISPSRESPPQKQGLVRKEDLKADKAVQNVKQSIPQVNSRSPASIPLDGASAPLRPGDNVSNPTGTLPANLINETIRNQVIQTDKTQLIIEIERNPPQNPNPQNPTSP